MKGGGKETMFTTYMNTANSTTGGTALDTTGQDIEVFKIMVGNPVTSANIWFYNETNVGNVTNTTGLVGKLTLPGTFATGQLPFTMDMTDGEGHGMTLNMGGTVAIDQALQMTVLWDYARQPSNSV